MGEAKIPLGDVELDLFPEDEDEQLAIMRWAKDHPGAKIPMDMWAETKSPEELAAIHAKIRERDLERSKRKERLSPFGQWIQDNPNYVEIVDMRAVMK